MAAYSIVDKVHEIKCKHLFMTIAMSKLWSNGEEFVEEVPNGRDLIMNEIADDLEEVLKELDKEAPKNVEKIKKQGERINRGKARALSIA